jgi:hypothetical protein
MSPEILESLTLTVNNSPSVFDLIQPELCIPRNNSSSIIPKIPLSLDFNKRHGTSDHPAEQHDAHSRLAFDWPDWKPTASRWGSAFATAQVRSMTCEPSGDRCLPMVMRPAIGIRCRCRGGSVDSTVDDASHDGTAAPAGRRSRDQPSAIWVRHEPKTCYNTALLRRLW